MLQTTLNGISLTSGFSQKDKSQHQEQIIQYVCGGGGYFMSAYPVIGDDY